MTWLGIAAIALPLPAIATQPPISSLPLIASAPEISAFEVQRDRPMSQQGIPQQNLAQQDTLTQAEVYRLENRVQLLPQDQSPRAASLGDVLVPLDSLQTATGAIAELLFNEGSIARINENTTFRFRQGLRRFELPNRIARSETIFVLENGIALFIVPPNGTATQVETPEGRINIVAIEPIASAGCSEPEAGCVVARNGSQKGRSPKNSPKNAESNSSPLRRIAQNNTGATLQPPEKSSVVMVSRDAATRTTQVFALTDGAITVSDVSGGQTKPLTGGQTVPIENGRVGRVQDFDLGAFYRTVPLAAGLGLGQESIVEQQPTPVQATLNQARIETIAAIRRQTRDRQGFTSQFLRDALTGSDSGFNGQRGLSNVTIIDPVVTPGIFTRTGENSAIFADGNDNVTEIEIDFDNRSIRINGNAGTANDAGLSGNNAQGTVIDRNGQVTRIQVLDVGGEEPPVGQSFRGTLTTGVAPDR
ncbi:MAG: FecR family protein [Oculatellaceae cyanobacterium Prado106]|nr:FecR family protein [Oculatellaceae cyanobacterium Prado106]